MGTSTKRLREKHREHEHDYNHGHEHDHHYRRPKRRRSMARQVAQLAHRMPTPEDTIRNFICNSLISPHEYSENGGRDDQLMAIALLSLPDIDTLQPPQTQETQETRVEPVRQVAEGKDIQANDNGSCRNGNGTVKNVLGWFKWMPQWPLLSSLRRLNLH